MLQNIRFQKEWILIKLRFIGPKARSDGYEITYTVEEPRVIGGGVSTLVGTNDGSVVSIYDFWLSKVFVQFFKTWKYMYVFLCVVVV